MKYLGRYIFFGTVAGGLFLTAVVWLPPLAIGLLNNLIENPSPILEVVVPIFVLGLGFILYFVREKHRHLYGAAEISFAVTAASYSASKLPNEIISLSNPSTVAPWMAILACTYIVVRGFENVSKGAEELRKMEDPLAHRKEE